MSRLPSDFTMRDRTRPALPALLVAIATCILRDPSLARAAPTPEARKLGAVVAASERAYAISLPLLGALEPGAEQAITDELQKWQHALTDRRLDQVLDAFVTPEPLRDVWQQYLSGLASCQVQIDHIEIDAAKATDCDACVEFQRHDLCQDKATSGKLASNTPPYNPLVCMKKQGSRWKFYRLCQKDAVKNDRCIFRDGRTYDLQHPFC
jgi:hypothetical protein